MVTKIRTVPANGVGIDLRGSRGNFGSKGKALQLHWYVSYIGTYM